MERLDKCLFKVNTDTGNLTEFFHNFFNFEKNFETTRFQLEKNWKNSLTPWLLLFKLKNTVLHWYFKEQKLYHTWKRLVQLQSWKKNWLNLEKNCLKARIILFNTLFSTFFNRKNTALLWYSKEQKLYLTWKHLVQLQTWKKLHKLEKNCQKLEKNCQKLEKICQKLEKNW